MRVDEGEGRIAGKGDALAGGRHRHGSVGAKPRPAGSPPHGVEIEIRRYERGGFRHDPVEFRRLLGLDEAEVPFGHRNTRIARQRADDGESSRLHSGPDEHLVPWRGHAVQDHAGDGHVRAHRGESQRHGRR